MGEISLPKPPTKLVCDVAGPDSVPGMLFPNDDEDFVKEDELKEFFGGLRKAMMFSFLKSLPMDDGPYFFENDEHSGLCCSLFNGFFLCFRIASRIFSFV